MRKMSVVFANKMDPPVFPDLIKNSLKYINVPLIDNWPACLHNLTLIENL